MINLDKVPEPTNLGVAVVDVATAWDARIEQLTRHGGPVYALRGAGSTGGIDPEAIDHVLHDVLIPNITEQLPRGHIGVMFDGDPDNPQKPDIGHVAGTLRNYFAPEVDSEAISFLTAQTDDWYYPEQPGANLANVSGQPYETFVFPRGAYPGDHNRFTQSPRLAAYPGYQQFYVGASGQLAADQMADYCRSVPEGRPVNVTLVRALINQSLTNEIGEKLAVATTAADRAKFERMLAQRGDVYGKHFDNDGQLRDPRLQEILRSDRSHQLVALWEADDQVTIVNAERIDLGSREIDEQFQAADYFVKTQPFRARQVPQGSSELVIVNSGATRDTAVGGDWIATSVGTGEEYVVKGDDFVNIGEPVPGQEGIFVPVRSPRKLVPVTRDVIFRTPWGEDQTIRAGAGYLMERVLASGPRAGEVERYGIAAKNVDGDFVPYAL